MVVEVARWSEVATMGSGRGSVRILVEVCEGRTKIWRVSCQ